MGNGEFKNAIDKSFVVHKNSKKEKSKILGVRFSLRLILGFSPHRYSQAIYKNSKKKKKKLSRRGFSLDYLSGDTPKSRACLLAPPL